MNVVFQMTSIQEGWLLWLLVNLPPNRLLGLRFSTACPLFIVLSVSIYHVLTLNATDFPIGFCKVIQQ